MWDDACETPACGARCAYDGCAFDDLDGAERGVRSRNGAGNDDACINGHSERNGNFILRVTDGVAGRGGDRACSNER